MPSNKKNSFWLSIQYIITLIVSLINLKINLLNFGSKLFGIWIMLAAVWGFGVALDFGFGTAVVKFVAEYNKHNKERLNIFLSSSFSIFVIIGILILLLGNFTGSLIYFYHGSIIGSDYIERAKTIFIILGFAFYFQYLTLFIKSIFEGVSNFILPSKISIAQNILLLIFVTFIYELHYSIKYLAIAYLSVYLLIFFFYLFSLKILYPDFKIKIRYFQFSEVKRVIGFSFSVQTISIFSALIDPVIKYIIGGYYKIEFVSIYEIARRFSIAISSLFFTTFRTILPRASILRTKEDIQKFFSDDIAKITKMGIAYSGLFFGIGAIFISIIIKVWFGFESAILIFLILALPESINNFGYANYLSLLGLGHALFLALLQFINLVVVIIFLISGFLIFKNSLGLLGYFISVLIGNSLMLVFVKTKIGINLREFLKSVAVNKLLVHCFLLLASIFCIYISFTSSYYVLAVLSIISLSIFYNDIKKYSQIFMEFIRSNLLNVSN